MDLGQDLKDLVPRTDTASLLPGVHRKLARRRRLVGFSVALLLLALVLPLSTFLPPRPSGEHIMMDWPYYSSVDDLLTVTDVVVAEATRQRSTIVEPTPAEPEDPGDPQQNPTLGVPDTEAEEMPPARYRVHHFVVNDVIRGDLAPGTEILVAEVEGPTPVAFDAGVTYVMFLADADDFYMLPNPFQGLYTVDDSGLIGAVTEEEPGIPFAEIEEYLNG